MMFPSTRFFLQLVDQCDSTNEQLLQKREEPGFHGRALLALRQTHGQGRRGKSWFTGEGNLALSIAFRLSPGDPSLCLFPFVVGVSLAEYLCSIASLSSSLRLKWPNDIYLDGKKNCGILSQARQGANSLDLVIGIGLNLRQAPEGENAIALEDFMIAPSPEAFAQQFLEFLSLRLAQTKDFESLSGSWERFARPNDFVFSIVGEEGAFRGVCLLETGEFQVEDICSGLRRNLSSEIVSLRFSKET